MRKAEVLGAAGATVGLLGVAIGLIKRLKKAYERQQASVEVLDSHLTEVQNVDDIVKAIIEEDALQTAVVAARLDALRLVASTLIECLKKLDPTGKSVARQYVHQILHGSDDEEALGSIMRKLIRVKFDLSVHLQLACVGMERIVRDTVLANAQAIVRINQLLESVLGTGQGLKLAGLLPSRDMAKTNGMNNLQNCAEYHADNSSRCR